MNDILKVSAPGKIILSGEHAVVYGYPALVSAVNRRLTINSSGKIDSRILIGCGMGSSAAFAVAASALKLLKKNRKLDLERINQIAYELEKKQHSNPSGVDNTVSTYGGYLWYRKESESLKLFKSFKPKKRLSNLHIINTGKPSESTGDMVTLVNSKYKTSKNAIESIFQSIEKVTKLFLAEVVSSSSVSVKELIKENEELLERLGVVSKNTMSLVRKIEKLGGSAKICGAGGLETNSGVLLVFNSDRDKLYNFVNKTGLDIFSVKFGEEGVRIEK
jgi:mevalonate kinase